MFELKKFNGVEKFIQAEEINNFFFLSVPLQVSTLKISKVFLDDCVTEIACTSNIFFRSWSRIGTDDFLGVRSRRRFK